MQKYVIQGIFMCWYRLATEPESGYSSEIKPGIHFFRGSVMLLKGDRGFILAMRTILYRSQYGSSPVSRTNGKGLEYEQSKLYPGKSIKSSIDQVDQW
jgi:hypothetical protein